MLSVIIVAWRSHDEIKACLSSIPRELTMPAGEKVSIEVIVVDNSLSADGTGEMVMREFPYVRYILPKENLGFGRANNLGFEQCSGECILFLNPDTVCNANAIRHCMVRVRTELNIGMLSPKLIQADGSMDLACRRSIPTAWDGFCRGSGLAAAFPRMRCFAGYNLTYLPAEGSYGVGAINGAFMLGRREVFERVANPKPYGVFDGDFFMYGDDLDLCIRVSRAGFQIVYDGCVQILHLKGQSVAKDYERMAVLIFDSNRDVYLKHFNPRGSRFVRLKYILAFGLWKRLSKARAWFGNYRKVRPL